MSDYGERRGSPVFAAFLTSLLTTAGAFAALTFADARGMLPFLHGAPSAVVEVPSIKGVSVEQARELLQARGLLFELHAERPDPTVPAGAIAAQEPLAGSRATRGTAIRAFVSSGAVSVAIPALAGTRPEDAVEQLRDRKLAIGPRREEASATVASGLVIATEPAEGQAVSPGAAVTLVVSKGPAAAPVPKVIGLRPSKAKKTLEDAGFKVGKTRYGSSDNYDEQVVIKQEPADGTPMAPGSEINLVINE
jgi:serine/threonine-protein kinase